MSKNLLLKVTGSIAAFKAASVASALVKKDWQVKVVMSESAKRFVGEMTFEGLTGHAVYDDLWSSGGAMDHIHLDRWASVILLCPASANTINKMAAGRADDLVSNLFLAHDFKKPYFVAPAMNTMMWSHPTTQASLKKLTDMNLRLLSPESGPLACGEFGEGRLLEPDKIVERIEQAVANKGRKILITAGGTEEPIDAVRSLTNTSTGKTGALIADHLSQSGFQVTALVAEKAQKPRLAQVQTFRTTDELEEQLEKHLSKERYEVVIQAAAISDFRAEGANAEKKAESDKPLSFQLIPREKTISKIKSWSLNKSVKILGFKLTINLDKTGIEKAVDKVFKNGADAVVSNQVDQITDSSHAFELHSPMASSVCGQTKQELSAAIERWIGGKSDLSS